ncbi:MAG: tetratricopeptide repeat protein [Bacteroidetes bacterium]|nr:tetratricopeptide repeat protein [Bacteroidota bacterium]
MSVKKNIPNSKKSAVSKTPGYKAYFPWIIVIAICVVTILSYLPVFDEKKEFTNWDDPVYVTENKLIRSTNAENIKKIFSPKTDVSLNYHPLTVYSLALNYKSGQLNPRPYFKTNLLIHVANVALVFYLIFLFSGSNLFVASAVAAWFGLHPMHVESVAWISERKDVLYTFFFLSALIAYVKYLDKKHIYFILICFLFFVCSGLSKAMAAPLPFVLILIDYLKQRKINLKVLLEKIPFLAFAFLIGINAVIIQSKEAINEFDTFTLFQRLMFASYGFVIYIQKMFVPISLSAFYPYPSLDNLGNIPVFFYLAPVVAVAIVVGSIIALYKYKKEWLPYAVFGFTFYFLTIAMVLQFISVGSALMADRYTYLSYIGLFFLVAFLMNKLLGDKKIVLILIIVVTSSLLASACYDRVKIWQNNDTLWSDVIKKYPLQVQVAYKNRGNYYAQIGRLDEAYKDHMTLINMKSTDAGVYVNFANICGLRKEFDKSLEAYSKALELKKENTFDIYLNRGITYAMANKFNEAISDFSVADSMQPKNEKLYQNRSFVLLQAQQYEASIRDYNFLIEIFPSEKDYYFNRGLAYFNLSKYSEAITDFNSSIKLKPDYAQAYFNLSVIYNQLKDYNAALENAKRAKQFGHPVTDAYLNELSSK